jgi:hypothetical protein
MRVILLLLIALAAGKVLTQVYIRQQAAESTIINAYRAQAIAACQRLSAYPPYYRSSVSVELEIGNKNLNVQLWQTSHRLWSARYEDPIILVRTEDRGHTSVCAYDINSGTVIADRPAPRRHSRG